MKLCRIVLVCSEPQKLAAFYEAAFGFTRVAQGLETDSALAQLVAVPGVAMETITLRLSEQELMLVGLRPGGCAYPPAVFGNSALFQHFAIVVADMPAAYARLLRQPGWSAISSAGPQRLPASSGAVTAFKFRDPEGHPLELITSTPPTVEARSVAGMHTLFLQINHSAISVANTRRSIEFYASLGFVRTGGSLNTGPEQDRLDGLSAVQVEVTALALPDFPTPHIELLCYAEGFAQVPAMMAANDIAATWLVCCVQSSELLATMLCATGAPSSGPVRFADGCVRALARDPDGHFICLEAPD